MLKTSNITTPKKYKELKYQESSVFQDKPKHFPITNSTTLSQLHDITWKQIEILQEEGDCRTKKILQCENAGYIAGFGAMIHRWAVCMQAAYGLGIVFIEESNYAYLGVYQDGYNQNLKNVII